MTKMKLALTIVDEVQCLETDHLTFGEVQHVVFVVVQVYSN